MRAEARGVSSNWVPSRGCESGWRGSDERNVGGGPGGERREGEGGEVQKPSPGVVTCGPAVVALLSRALLAWGSHNLDNKT